MPLVCTDLGAGLRCTWCLLFIPQNGPPSQVPLLYNMPFHAMLWLMHYAHSICHAPGCSCSPGGAYGGLGDGCHYCWPCYATSAALAQTAYLWAVSVLPWVCPGSGNLPILCHPQLCCRMHPPGADCLGESSRHRHQGIVIKAENKTNKNILQIYEEEHKTKLFDFISVNCWLNCREV